MDSNALSKSCGLSLATIQQICALFSQHPHIEKAILYGSRAKGNYREGSDIDLTLIGPSLDALELSQLENELDDLLLPYTVDLSLYHQITTLELLQHIKRVGQIFYQKII